MKMQKQVTRQQGDNPCVTCRKHCGAVPQRHGCAWWEPSYRDDKSEPGGWRDVFDRCDYSGGPGDNVYVYVEVTR
jgi:hypothetical protein